jgi:cell division protein FtsW
MPAIARTHRWVQFAGVQFQPSELAKISLVLFLAFYCETKKDTLNEWKTLALPFGVLGAAVFLVLLEPDFGTALMLAALSCAMLLIGGVKLKRFLVPLAVLAVIFPIFLFSQSYRLDRVRGFLSGGDDPLGKGYQVYQSKIAVGAGGLIGVGLGESTQRLSFLPFAHTDFIYAILGEETGLVGATLTLGLFLLLLWRGMKIASAAPDPALKMVAAGLSLMLVAQALLNVTIVLGLGPAKGIPLPFLSYGRSSLICSLAAAGILLHISQKRGAAGQAVRI